MTSTRWVCTCLAVDAGTRALDIAREIGHDVDPDAIHAARAWLRRSLSDALSPVLLGLYRDMAPLMKTEGELLLAHTVSELMAAHFQIVEALMAARRADESACDLSNALKNQFNVQMDGVSRRLEELEKRRRKPF